MKKKMKLMFFYAHWDGTTKLKDLIFSLCKERDIWFEGVYCESKEGIFLSKLHDVKLCPYIVLFKNDKEIKRGVAQEIIEEVFGEY